MTKHIYAPQLSLDPITERYERWVRCSCPWDAVRTPARLAQEAQRKKQQLGQPQSMENSPHV
jgi:hypothetical protein